MAKGKRLRAEREARQIAHQHTQYVEGTWMGEVGRVGEIDEDSVAAVLVRRYNEAADDVRACPHLQDDLDQARFWVEAVPELLACANCTPVVAAEEKKRANTCCLYCGKHVALKGVTAAVGGLVLRGGICADCEPRALAPHT